MATFRMLHLGIAKPIVLHVADDVVVEVVEFPLAKHVHLRRRTRRERALRRLMRMAARFRARLRSQDMFDTLVRSMSGAGVALRCFVLLMIGYLMLEAGAAFWTGKVARILATPVDCTKLVNRDLQDHCLAIRTGDE